LLECIENFEGLKNRGAQTPLLVDVRERRKKILYLSGGSHEFMVQEMSRLLLELMENSVCLKNRGASNPK